MVKLSVVFKEEEKALWSFINRAVEKVLQVA